MPGYEGSPGRLGGFVRGSLHCVRYTAFPTLRSLLDAHSFGCGLAVWLTEILHGRHSRTSRLSWKARQIVRTCVIGLAQFGHSNELKPPAAGPMDPSDMPQPSPESRRAALR